MRQGKRPGWAKALNHVGFRVAQKRKGAWAPTKDVRGSSLRSERGRAVPLLLAKAGSTRGLKGEKSREEGLEIEAQTEDRIERSRSSIEL